MDKDKPNYLIPISPILLLYLIPKHKYKYNIKLVNLINLDKPNTKYLVPISPI